MGNKVKFNEVHKESSVFIQINQTINHNYLAFPSKERITPIWGMTLRTLCTTMSIILIPILHAQHFEFIALDGNAKPMTSTGIEMGKYYGHEEYIKLAEFSNTWLPQNVISDTRIHYDCKVFQQ